MLTPEQAAEALEARRKDARPGRPWITRGPRVHAAAKLVGDPRTASDDAVRALDELGDRARRSAFEALLPGFGGTLAGLWDDAGRATFQDDWDRRPFRSPRRPELARERLVTWLGRSAEQLRGYHADPVWLARWAGHLAFDYRVVPGLVGALLARLIDDGDDDVLGVLLATTDGTDEIATMGRHLPVALLGCARPEAWEAITTLLLAAQREEGVRQVILETVDEAHPDAFRRVLDTIAEHDLDRFAAVARGIGVWLGLELPAADRRGVRRLLETIRLALTDPEARDRAQRTGTAEELFVALWATATTDTVAAAHLAAGRLDDPDPERAHAAVALLARLRTDDAVPGLLRALDGDDLRSVATAVDALGEFPADTVPASHDRISALLTRVTARRTPLPPSPWSPRSALERERIGQLLAQHRSVVDLDAVLPWLDALDPWRRMDVVVELGKHGTTAEHRRAFVARLGDSSADVRKVAIAGAAMLTLSDDEALGLEALLTRRPGDLRRGITDLIVRRGDAWALGAAERLLTKRSAQQRLGGVEVLRRIAEHDGPEATVARERLAALEGGEDDDEVVVAAAGRATDREATGIDETDGFGLFAVDDLTPVTAPRRRARDVRTAAATRALQALLVLIAEHAETPVEIEQWDGEPHETLFGTLSPWSLRTDGVRGHRAGSPSAVAFPLAEVWLGWADTLPDDAVDPDGLQLVRAYFVALAQADDEARGPGERPAEIAVTLLRFVLLSRPDRDLQEAVVDLAEGELARLGRKDLEPGEFGDRRASTPALELAREVLHAAGDDLDRAQMRRLWALERWFSEPPGAPRPPVEEHWQYGAREVVGDRMPWRPPLAVVCDAFDAGAASEADVVDHLVGPRGRHDWFGDLERASSVTEERTIPDGVRAIAARIRERVVALELQRGEAPTRAARPALTLALTGHEDVLIAAVRALGRDRFVRGWSGDGESRAAVFSHLVVASRPAGTSDAFPALVAEAGIAPARLREVACYAPQWCAHVEAALGEDGFADAIWWLHAHTKDDRWQAPMAVRDRWRDEVARRTALDERTLMDGAVDVGWFARVRATLGDDALDLALKAAKYGSTAGGHKRAELYAQAMRGAVGEDELLARIDAKRHQDAVRALGLLPLPAAPAAREAATRRRYEVIEEFRRGSRAFGSQRRTTEGRAADIGLENLARTAGHADPVRLTWAVEAQSTQDLRGDGTTATLDDLRVTLRIDDDGRPDLTVARGGKTLRAVPAKAKKDPQVAALTTRATHLRRQAGRVRRSLEQAMVGGDPIGGDELAALREHAVLWPQLRTLVLAADRALGLPRDDGRALVDHDGAEHALAGDAVVRIAHPSDLLATGEWSSWQRWVMADRVVQPVRQVFRELYVAGAAEEQGVGRSRRYAGQQLQPGRARALLTARGWTISEDGVERTDHRRGITASLWFLDGFGSPVDVEPPVLEQVAFTRAGSFDAVPLADVPPLLFSEVMRDVDLVVSVAHASGVDPEATMSSIDARRALLRETLDVVGIENVRFEDDARALVDGTIGRYSVHLGSGTVHLVPGGAVCIVPVHAQQRGRVFLPFADDDPKTAEIVSKVLALARDEKIRDPTILEQLRR